VCGIAGIVHWSQGDPAGLGDAVSTMVAALAHRGPDARGWFVGPVAAVGATRLSIIDLSDDANQPMHDPTGRWHLVYNGEIYNYLELREELGRTGWRFRTRSDTEVVLASLITWGPSATSRFNGMWAFALVDDLEGTVLLSRDRFGVKPLFYHRAEDGGLLFASEAKAILAARPDLGEIDDVEIARFLLLGALGHGERSTYRRIHRIAPGENVLASRRGTTRTRFWAYPEPDPVPPPFEQARERFLDLLEDAVRLRLRSDVAAATTLSGGLDSSGVVALIGRIGARDHRTYTAAFPGADFDEGPQSRRLSTALGFPNRGIASNTQRLDLDVLSNVVRHMDGPTLNPATVPLWGIMRAVRDDGVKVVLDGQGADELLGGYTNLVAPFGIMDSLTERGLLAAMSNSVDFARRWGWREAGIWTVRTQVPGAHGIYQRTFGLRRMAGERLRGFHTGSINVPMPVDDRVNQRLRWQHVVLLGPLLEYGDRMSMAHGVETRSPFMDYRVVEFVTALPGDYKVRGGTGKVLEREAFRSMLPREILDSPKLGFVTPVQRWFSGADGTDLLERLADGAAVEAGYLSRSQVLRQMGATPSVIRATGLFRFLTLELWLDQLADRRVRVRATASR